MNLLQDPRLKKVQWRDLIQMTLRDKAIENTVNLPWLAASLILAHHGLYLLALPCSAVFFLTSLRLVHNGFHQSLGLPRKMYDAVFFINSLLMFSSIHAVKFNHLRHHKYCLQEEDVEGSCARMSALKAILHGPVFIWNTHRTALKLGSKKLVRYIWLELGAISLMTAVAVGFGLKFLMYHIAAMTIAEFLSGFFAVWTVHHDCDEHVFARTSSKIWKNFITYNMFYHLEHHLFPQVPTIKLSELSRRLKEQLPDVEVKEVF